MEPSTIRTAILSYGMSGEVFHAPLLHALPEFQLAKVVERKSDRSRQHYQRIEVVRSVEEVFSDPDIDLVIVNTPNETHVDFAMRALSAGKHVVVEKPFTVRTADAQALVRKAESVGRILTVFQNRRWDSDFLTVQKILSGNDLGKIVEFEAHYDRFRNYIEADSWKEQSGAGRGVLYNLGSHMLDQVVVLFGMPLYVDARIGVRRPGGKVDDYYDIRLEYADHLAIVKSSYLVKELGPRYIVHGTNGSFVKYGIDPQEQALKEKKDPRDASWGTEPEEMWGKLHLDKKGESIEKRVPSERGDYLAFYRDLYHAIRHSGKCAVEARQVSDVIRLIEACYESNEKKCAIKMS